MHGGKVCCAGVAWWWMLGSMGAVTPGFVCAHHHLYSTLARGMPAPPKVPTNFREILEQIWWRLDAALDLDMLRASARLGAVEALLCGTTGIVDHHESPNAIEGSLDVIAEACAEVGVRVVCAYGVTDRHGADGSAARPRRERAVRARRWPRAGRCARGVHVHATTRCRRRPDWLPTSASACTSTSPRDPPTPEPAGRLRVVGRRRLAAGPLRVARPLPLPGTIAHNPRSNMNNGVGYARPARWGNDVVLGTDGIGADMLEEYRLAYVAHRADDVLAVPDTAWSWVTNGHRLLPECLGDQVTWTYDHADSPWHVAFTPGIRVTDVVGADGEVLVAGGLPDAGRRRRGARPRRRAGGATVRPALTTLRPVSRRARRW